MRLYVIAAALAAVFCQSGFGQPVAATKPQAAATPISMPTSALGDSNDWRFAFPGSPVLASFHLGRILRLPAVAEALKNVPPASQAQMNMGLKMIEGIEKIQVSIRPAPVSRVAGAKTFSNTSGNKAEDPEVLLLVTGELGPMLHLILEQQGGPKGVGYRQIAPNVLLLGKNGPLEQAARRMASAPAPGNLSGVEDSLSQSDVWIGGDTSMMAAMGQTQPPPGLDTLKRFSVGMNLGDPFELNVHLLSTNEAGSDKILGLYSLAMAAASGSTPPELAPLVERIKVDKQGSEVRVSFSAPVAMLQAAAANSQALKNAGGAAGLSPALAGFLGGGATAGPGMTSAAPVPAAPPAPKKPGKIMIYGLDDGPREVVVPARN